MVLEKARLEELLQEACTNAGVAAPVELPTRVAQEFARLVGIEQESRLRTAGCVLAPALQMAIAMGSIDGPPNMVEDIKRGYRLLADAL